MIITRTATFIAALFMSGCYSYVPVATVEPPTDGQKVRVYLSDEGVLDAAERLGPGVSVLEGDVLGARSDSFTLAVRHLKTRTRGEILWNGEAVTLSKASVEILERQKISRWRTFAAIGVAAIGAYFLSSAGGIRGDAIERGTDLPEQGPVQ